MNKPMTREEIECTHDYWEIDNDLAIVCAKCGVDIARSRKKRKSTKSTGCENCHKLYFELNAKIKELENHKTYYDRMFAKSVVIPTEEYAEMITTIRELEKEVEQLTLKPSTQKVANCLCCQKIKKVEEIDKKTGCCEGGCK